MLGTNTVGSAYVYDEDGKIRGSRVLDLRESITTLDGTKWTITHFGISDGTSVIWSNSTPMREFYAPRELKEIGSNQLFNNLQLTNEAGEKDAFEYIHFDCPALSEENAGRWGFVFNTETRAMTLDIPSIKNIWSAFLRGVKIKDENSSDFSSVEYIGKEQATWSPLSSSSISISFPNVKKIDEGAFAAGDFSVMRFGTCGNTLTQVSTNACYIRNGGNVNLKGLILGTAAGCKIQKGAFQSSDRYELYTVKFLGAMPELDEGLIFGRTNMFDSAGNKSYDASLKTVFFIPATAEWDSVRSSSRELTEEEKQKFGSRFPSTTAQYGLTRVSVVPESVFHTEGEQFLITFTEEERLAETDVKLSISSGNANITVNGKPFIEDFCKSLSRVYRYGTEITLVIDIPEGEEPSDLIGLPQDAVINGNTITFTMNQSTDLMFKNAFVFDRENMIITDGIWNIKVKVKDEAEHTLIVDTSALSLVDSSNSNNGVLDMRGVIVSKDNQDERWTIVDFSDKSFKNANSVVSFYAPRTIVQMGSQLFNGSSTLKNLVFDTPYLTGQFGKYGWSFDWNEIECFVIKAPKLDSFEENGTFEKSTFVNTDLDEWDLSGLTSLPQLSLQIKGPGPRGTLRLPALKTIGFAALKNWSNLERIELGTNGDLTSVDSNVFWNCSSLRSIDFGESVQFECHEKAFLMNYTEPLNISEVSWSSLSTPKRSLIDKILSGRVAAADNGDKPVKIRVNEKAIGWHKLVSLVDRNNEKEMKAAEALRTAGEKVAGVYVNEAGQRLAWVLGFEFRKFVITLR